MSGRRWWIPLAFIVPSALVAWLSVVANDGVMTWVAYGLYGAAFVSVVVRTLLPSKRGKRVRSVAEPLVGGASEIQTLYLGQPVLGPVQFGDDAPQATTLVLDDPPPDPGDLRRDA